MLMVGADCVGVTVPLAGETLSQPDPPESVDGVSVKLRACR